MDKYPVWKDGKTVGEMTVSPEALYTVFDIFCPEREGLWCVWAVGKTGTLRIGVPEPENGRLHIRRRFSRQLTAPLGTVLRGELRSLNEEREHWEPLRADMLRSSYLRRRLVGLPGILTCQADDCRLIAIPRDDSKPFPLEAMFCFAQPRRLRGRNCWVFRFDRHEWPVF